RSFSAAALGPDGHIYVIGGTKGGSSDSSNFLHTVEAYDPTTDTWTCSIGDINCATSLQTIAPMPTQREALGAATGPDGQIYAVGGAQYTTILDTVETF